MVENNYGRLNNGFLKIFKFFFVEFESLLIYMVKGLLLIRLSILKWGDDFGLFIWV